MSIETREVAMVEATRRFGERAVVGYGRPTHRSASDCHYVGWKDKDEWVWLGMGASWDEAFASLSKVKQTRGVASGS